MADKKTNEAGPTGLVSRLGSGFKSLVPGQIGQAGKAEGTTKLAAKKIWDKLLSSSKGMGLDPNALTLKQVLNNPLFPDERSQKIAQIAWQQLKLGKVADKKQLEAFSLKWVQLYQQNKGHPKKHNAPVV